MAGLAVAAGDVTAADITIVEFTAVTASQALTSVIGILVGCGIYESTGITAATALLRDGTSSAGTLLVPYTLLANESARDYLAPYGLPVSTGVWLDVVSGSVSGCIWVAQ